MEDALLGNAEQMVVGMVALPEQGDVPDRVSIALRELRRTDPPIVLAFPLILAKSLS